MSTASQDPMILHYANLFAEKTELLAVEDYEIFKRDREIDRVIGIIVLHQAAELTLKALCIIQRISIVRRGEMTIGFAEMMRNLNDNLANDDLTAL